MTNNAINPDHPVTQAVEANWHKLLAMTIVKYKLGEVHFTTEDINTMIGIFGGEMPVVMVHSKNDALIVKLIPESEAMSLAIHENRENLS